MNIFIWLNLIFNSFLQIDLIFVLSLSTICKKLQETGIEEVILSFINDCDRQQNQSDFQMVCYDRLFLFGAENCVSNLFGTGVKLEFGGNALLLGSIRTFEHRDGHWSDPMKSFASMSRRTSNIFSCGRHIGGI